MSAFPYNVVDELRPSFLTVEGVTDFLTRPLRPSDPDGAVSAFPADWQPKEMHIGMHDPSIAHYLYTIQILVKHTDEEEGKRLHAQISKNLRTLMYRDPDLRLRLAQLSETSFGVQERTQKWGIRREDFLANEISGQFLFVSSMELVVDVESVPA